MWPNTVSRSERILINFKEITVLIFGCKSTTQYLMEHLMKYHFKCVLITIEPELALKNEVADFRDLTAFCNERNIDFYKAKSYSLSDVDDFKYISQIKADIGFAMGWQRLIPLAVLNVIRLGVFGMHGSSRNLPFGRGRSPLNWSIIEGRRVFYTNLFRYDSGADSGDIVATYKFGISDKDNACTLHWKNLMAMKYLIDENIENLLSGTLVFSRQPTNLTSTYYPKRVPEDGVIDWTHDVYLIERLIRAQTRPFSGAYTWLDGEKVHIWEAQVFDFCEFGHEKAMFGEVVEVFGNDGFIVKAAGGLMLITNYSCQRNIRTGLILNGNDMSLSAFPVNSNMGYDMKEGE